MVNQGPRRRVARLAGVLAAILAGLALVILSPFALRELGTLPGFDWAKLSNIGQAYGAAAALLTALALIGVTATLLVQAKEARTGQEQAARTFHFDLLKLAIGDDDLREIMTVEDEPKLARQHLYGNLWINYWRAMYRIGYMTEQELRLGLSKDLFTSAVGRRVWEWGRPFYLADAWDRRTRRFCEIVDSEYKKVVRDQEALSAHAKTLPRRQASAVTHILYPAGLLTMGAGVVLLRFIIRRNNKATSQIRKKR